MGKRWLLSWIRCGVVLSLSLTDDRSVHYFDEAWLMRATGIVGSTKREYKLK
jgi:hypothetical protein